MPNKRTIYKVYSQSGSFSFRLLTLIGDLKKIASSHNYNLEPKLATLHTILHIKYHLFLEEFVHVHSPY